MRGLDIYRYQTVTDWWAVKNSGVGFILVKLTDGFGPAIVRGDAQVSGCKTVGIPVGGYHFAQKGSPRSQARVFIHELSRLNALDIMPALDIENSGGVTWGGTEAHNFASEFCTEMLTEYPRVLLYANTSELRAMRAAEIVARFNGAVLIWEANYGSNNGVRNSLPANPWAPWHAIHQYTSKGRVPGIIEDTDLNESFMDLSLEEGMADINPAQRFRRDWDGFELDMRTFILETWQNSTDAVLTARQNKAKLDAQAGLISDVEANLLVAFDQRPTNIEMTQENVQQLLTGMSTASVKAFREVATAILAGTEEGES